MPTVALCPLPKLQFFDSNGDPLSGGKIYTYEVDTTTNKATYNDATGSQANANPVVLDSRGEASVWLLTDQNYKFVLKDSADATIWTINNFGFYSPTFQTLTVTGNETVGGTLTVAGLVTASAGINVGQWLCFASSDIGLTLTTGATKFSFRLPACTILAARASLVTASSSGIPTFDINDDGTSIFDTAKLTIDANELTSTTAGASPTILNPTVADDSLMTIDIDVAGTGAKGWAVYLKILWT